MIGTGSWNVHVWMESNYADTQWCWTADSPETGKHGEGRAEYRRSAIKQATRFCDNPSLPEEPNKYDFTFSYATGRK